MPLPGHQNGWALRCSFHPEECSERKSGSVGHSVVWMPRGGDYSRPLPVCIGSGSYSVALAGPCWAEVSQDTAQSVKHSQKIPPAISDEALRRLRLPSQGMLRSGLCLSPAPDPSGGVSAPCFPAARGRRSPFRPPRFAPCPPRPARRTRRGLRGAASARGGLGRPGPAPARSAGSGATHMERT